jgi:hypothetical protein
MRIKWAEMPDQAIRNVIALLRCLGYAFRDIPEDEALAYVAVDEQSPTPTQNKSTEAIKEFQSVVANSNLSRSTNWISLEADLTPTNEEVEDMEKNSAPSRFTSPPNQTTDDPKTDTEGEDGGRMEQYTAEMDTIALDTVKEDDSKLEPHISPKRKAETLDEIKENTNKQMEPHTPEKKAKMFDPIMEDEEESPRSDLSSLSSVYYASDNCGDGDGEGPSPGGGKLVN